MEKENKNEQEQKITQETQNSNMKFENEFENNEEKEIQNLKNQIEELSKENADKDDKIKRLMAEFENFKKRSEKERTNLYSSVMGDVISSLLPIVDNLEKASEMECKDEQYKDGVKMVLTQFKDVLKNNGLKEIETIGKPFDPSIHEAVSSVQDNKLGEKIIKEEYRKGYMIGDKVLRHSLVVVAN